MANKQKKNQDQLARRRSRVRAKVSGTPDRPRLSVFVSNRYIYTQLIDDLSGKTLLGLHMRSLGEPNNVKGAQNLGESLAAQAKKQGIAEVVLDRGSKRYAGKVKAVAEGARTGGLNF